MDGAEQMSVNILLLVRARNVSSHQKRQYYNFIYTYRATQQSEQKLVHI